MRSLVVAISTAHILFGHASRVTAVDNEAIAVDMGEEMDDEAMEFESEEEAEREEAEWGGGDGYGRGFFRKYKPFSVKKAEAMFNGGGERLLVDGENVDMAWKKGENDVLMFTNKRVLHVDAMMNFNNINKKRYTSQLWRTFGSWAIKTVDDIADNDCELELFDNYKKGRPDVFNLDVNGIPISIEHKFSPLKLGMWHFDFYAKKNVSSMDEGTWEEGVDIFEINAYVEKKIYEAKAWQKSNQIGVLLANSRMWFNADRHAMPNRLSKLKHISNSAGLQEMNRLGQLVSGDEKVLYAFKESKRMGKQDVLVMTNKRVVMADYRRFYSDAKVKFYNVPFDDKPTQMINAWEIETAGVVGDRDAEFDISSLTGERFHVEFRKKHVSNANLLDMHYDLSKEILKDA